MIGPNGIGKSNLLEAVELLGSLRSHRCSQDRDLIQWDRPLALLRADVGDGDRLELELRRRGGRQARRNGKVLDRQLDLIGPLRCIGFSALDLDLVRGEPALRRDLPGCSLSVSAPASAIEALRTNGFVIDPNGIRAMGLRPN